MGSGQTYGTQLGGRHHRRNRPYTFLNYAINQYHHPADVGLEGRGNRWHEAIEFESNSYPAAKKGEVEAYPLSITRAATSSTGSKYMVSSGAMMICEECNC